MVWAPYREKFIMEFMEEDREYSVREIMDGLNLKVLNARKILNNMAKKGKLIKRKTYTHNSWKIPGKEGGSYRSYYKKSGEVIKDKGKQIFGAMRNFLPGFKDKKEDAYFV